MKGWGPIVLGEVQTPKKMIPVPETLQSRFMTRCEKWVKQTSIFGRRLSRKGKRSLE